ncbi:MAG: hypothetical protein QM758_24800 [Armatimonas sp.]
MTDPKQEARDPNTSPKRLAELLYGFTSDVLENPALPLILLENPGWLDEIDTERLLKLLNTSGLPAYLVEPMTQNPRQPIVVNAKMHVALGTEVTDWEPLLRNLAALNCYREDRGILEKYELIPGWLQPYLEPSAPPKKVQPRVRKPLEPLPLTEEQKQTLRASPEHKQRQIAMTTKSIEEVVFLLEHAPDIVATYAARNPVTPLSWLEKLMETHGCLYELVGNPSMTPELLSRLIDKVQVTGPDYVMDRVGFHPACTPELAKRLEGLNVYDASLGRFRTTAELETLFLAGGQWALEEVRGRDNVPRWLVAEGLMQEIQKRRAYLPWFCGLLALEDQKRLSKNVRSANWFTRFAIAIHPSTKPKTLEKLVDDANRYVRFSAKARLSDTAWVFPPAACGGQGETF